MKQPTLCSPRHLAWSNFWLAQVWPPGLQDNPPLPLKHGLKLSQGKLSPSANTTICCPLTVHPRQQHASTNPHPRHHHPTASNTDMQFLSLHALFPSNSKELNPLPVLSMDSIQHQALTGETWTASNTRHWRGKCGSWSYTSHHLPVLVFYMVLSIRAATTRSRGVKQPPDMQGAPYRQASLHGSYRENAQAATSY